MGSEIKVGDELLSGHEILRIVRKPEPHDLSFMRNLNEEMTGNEGILDGADLHDSQPYYRKKLVADPDVVYIHKRIHKR